MNGLWKKGLAGLLTAGLLLTAAACGEKTPPP